MIQLYKNNKIIKMVSETLSLLKHPFGMFLKGIENVIVSGNIFFVKPILKNPGGGPKYIKINYHQMVMN